MIQKIFLFFTTLTLFSCDYFDYHQLDGKADLDGERNNYNATVLETETFQKDNIRFAFMGDTHRNDHETEAFVKHINRRTDIDAVIHAGDITDFGLKKEYEWTCRILDKLNFPHIVLIGNHDIIAYGDLIYQTVYGPENFTFKIGKYKFITLNTNRLEYRNPVNVPDFNFIDKEIAEDYQNGTIFLMHSPPGSEQFDEETRIMFSEKLSRIRNLYFCLHGHTHKHTVTEPLNDGITYISCDNIKKRTYLVFDVTPDGYKYEVVEF